MGGMSGAVESEKSFYQMERQGGTWKNLPPENNNVGLYVSAGLSVFALPLVVATAETFVVPAITATTLKAAELTLVGTLRFAPLVPISKAALVKGQTIVRSIRPISSFVDLAQKAPPALFKTNPSQAVLYSGPGQRELARASSGTPIDRTLGGQLFNSFKLDKLFTRPDVDSVWTSLSEKFVSMISGNASTYIQGAQPNRTFMMTEVPAMLRNPNITNTAGIVESLPKP